ncbi:ECF RNA polymerase sigma factor SigF [Methylobacterium crusticola]|uniref:ECF RNA polymerase sigma factor SigF n=1 Tax=Methylobacterium crusticola TaxID=1697972 RepID=A0ABQ4QTX1_9HYPH|nr:sigma-70 family RNA polymerase sigma factor [Methylobacterium crusticola]GJD48037.1 ECF RNA polymerase sigma factor SigF [Methylobacterium crusticola]
MSLERTLAQAMAAAQGGDAAAYRGLLRGCQPVIAAQARAQGLTGEAVDDVIQETLITLHAARRTYDPARPFLPWLRAIARRRAVDALRRQGRRPREVHDPLAYEAFPDLAPAPGDALAARERAAGLKAAVAALPAGQREAVEHLAYQERSLEEAAALTGRSKGALKVNFHRALKGLRARFGGREDGDA